MPHHQRRLTALLAVSLLGIATVAWALGVPVSETKEQLELKFDLSAVPNGDSVTVRLTINDLGKLKPLADVMLVVPTAKKGDHGIDLYMPMATREHDGELTAWAQLSRDLAERATIELVPAKVPDGQLGGWVFYPIPVKDYIPAPE